MICHFHLGDRRGLVKVGVARKKIAREAASYWTTDQ
jgi:hypothetical protein